MKFNCYSSIGKSALIIMLSCIATSSFATEYKVHLNNITADGGGNCFETFDINTATTPAINNINVRVGGNNMISAPGRWSINSPTDFGMSDQIFGFSVATATYKYHESNTNYHTAVESGTWELVFAEPFDGTGCAQFIKSTLIFDVTP